MQLCPQGAPSLLGEWGRTFFFQRHKLKGTSFFLGGVVIVLLRWPLLGMCLETYGFFSLFR